MNKKIQKLQFAYNHPLYLYNLFLLRRKNDDLNVIWEFHTKQTLKILSEKFRDTSPTGASQPEIIHAVTKFGCLNYPGVLYVACRLLKPEIVLETGAGAGLASTFILQALNDNQFGTLISIDKPRSVYSVENGNIIDEGAWVPSGKQSGWLVPENLRSRWKFLEGESSIILPALLKKYGPIDIFFHDSEHTYANMLFEYSSVWPLLRIGGLLFSHDIGLNSAFADFCHNVNKSFLLLTTGLGLVTKA